MTTNDSPNSSGSLVLGIDTGGTYTDGVLLEHGSRRVLAAHKSLTTRRDFSIGIEEVIEQIHLQDPGAVGMVSISTTLATNAIAEGKGKPVGLLLLGYDPDLIQRFGLATRFATPHYVFLRGGHDLHGREKEPPDLAGIEAAVLRLKDEVEAFAISGYFSPLNPEHENQARDVVARLCDYPVVLGHQLSTKLGSVERATTAALNASLLAVLQDFVVAVRQAMVRRNIHAPLMVMRGDGTLMSDAFAARAPVETIHSGPAASAIGGRFLTGTDDALVIDIGGTTTDLALVQGGQVAVHEEGAVVGQYKTAVKAANLLSIGLGGDSHVSLDNRGDIIVGPRRVRPLALLAQEHPEVGAQLAAATRQGELLDSPRWLEYWYLLREPQGGRGSLSDRQRALLALLEQGPQPVPALLKRLGLFHVTQVGADDLLRREILGQAALTPTDLLHVEGRFLRWDRAAAREALTVFSRFAGKDEAAVHAQVRRQMTERIVAATVGFLSGVTLEKPLLGQHDGAWWFFQNSLYDTHSQLETRIRLKLPIIGIGAPAGIFLQDVADALGTELILPAHHGVANAVGAVAASVMVHEEILVYPQLTRDGLEVVGYYVQSGDGRVRLASLEEAVARARAEGSDRAISAALEAGAHEPELIIEETADGIDTFRIRVRAMGTPRLGGAE
jgi:N-methylhydantoinase A/oxoprolinase/acetone carboxylase beta subunit